MIQIEVKRHKDTILAMQIKNHAGYDEKGKDLVCAGVSCIAIGALNAIDQNGDVCDLIMKEAYVSIDVKLPEDHDTQVMLEMLRIQLITMQEAYPSYIQYCEQEL